MSTPAERTSAPEIADPETQADFVAVIPAPNTLSPAEQASESYPIRIEFPSTDAFVKVLMARQAPSNDGVSKQLLDSLATLQAAGAVSPRMLDGLVQDAKAALRGFGKILAAIKSTVERSPAVHLLPGGSSHGEDDSYIDQRSSFIPKDIFIRMARQGAFPTYKVGKRILARRVDVRQAIERCGNVRSSETTADSKLDELRRSLGLAQKGKGGEP